MTMEKKELYLYKVHGKCWSHPAYVAAENHQQAVDKIATDYDENPCELSVDYVDMVTV